MSGKVLIFNRAAERITGKKKEAIIGQQIDSILPFFAFPFPDGRKEETIMVEGSQKIIGLGVSTLKGIDEKIKGYIIIFQDLTDKKRLEAEMKQKEKWAAIGELSSSIAHEIRNPLASLKSSVEMLREDLVPKHYKDMLMEIALNEMVRLNRIITDFLTYSRPSHPEMKRIDIHEILDETVEFLKNVEQNKNTITIEKLYSGSLQVHVDPQKMKQVFWNLGLNALESMPHGGELVISTRHSNGFIHIHFKDSGIGIEEKDIEKIFYPFFTTKEHGTGLGLAIAYRIVEEHKGRISVESNVGIGTNFEIILKETDEEA
jgi:signal transduction histidine kinase